MSATTRPNGASGMAYSNEQDPSATDSTQSYFHQQRAILVSDIAQVCPLSSLGARIDFPSQSLDTLLHSLNRLNRSLESITTVGNEFSSVEALWSQFEGVMGDREEKDADRGDEDEAAGGAEEPQVTAR